MGGLPPWPEEWAWQIPPQAGNVFFQERIAPSRRDLKPMASQAPSVFPVYPNLVDRMIRCERHPNRLLAHVLSVCSGYGYADADVVSMMMARLGLEGNHCRMISLTVDAMFIQSVAFLVQSADGRVVILCYRGTEPLNALSWLTSSDAYAEKLRFSVGSEGPFDVHAGFYRNVRSTRYEVIQSMQRALEGKSVLTDEDTARWRKQRRVADESEASRSESGVPRRPLEALFITGHSLGGAMAALMTTMLLNEYDEHSERGTLFGRFRALYTFGQPMVGDAGLAGACDRVLERKVMRYIYEDDPVPSNPPKSAGPYSHFGTEIVREDGVWSLRGEGERTTQAASMLSLAGSFAAFVTDQLVPTRRLRKMLRFPYTIADHRPHNYVTALTPGGIASEFGD